MLTLESGARRIVGFEINDVAGNDGEDHAASVNPLAAEHAFDLDAAKIGEQVMDKIGIHHWPDQRASAASSLNGVSCTLSPQPQADVWFGLLKTNCADIFSVL